MSKELEAYNEFLNIIEFPVKSYLLNSNDKLTLERYRVLRTQIETALKALEIIKEKNVCISVLKDSNSVGEYNDIICYHKVCSMSFEKPISLTQEEYDLLKEILL